MLVRKVRSLFGQDKPRASSPQAPAAPAPAASLDEQLIPKVEVHEGDPQLWSNFILQSLPYPVDCTPARKESFQALRARYNNPETFLRDPNRIVQFTYLMEIANVAEAGDYLEIGTFRGDSARLIHKLMDPTRQLYCLDTYEGFVPQDLESERKINPNHTWQVGNFLDTSVDFVGRNIGDGEKPENVTLVKGWFPESFHREKLEDRDWRFIHLDMDLYEPTRIGLQVLWPKLVPGGVMVFHDYGNNCFPGVKMAVDLFFDALGLPVIQVTDLWGSAVVVKPHAPGRNLAALAAPILNQKFFNQSGVGTHKIMRFDSTLAKGQWYWEIHSPNAGVLSGQIAETAAIGVLGPDHPVDTELGTVAGGWGWRADGMAAGDGCSATPCGTPTVAPGDVTFMVAYDADNGRLWFGRDGTWFGSNPETGKGAAFSAITGSVVPAMCSRHGGGGTAELNSRLTDDCLRFQPPKGFRAPMHAMV